VNASGRDYPVAFLEGLHHLLVLLVPPALGSDEQEVEDRKYGDPWQSQDERVGLRLCVARILEGGQGE
jgi:hypothetical protein